MYAYELFAQAVRTFVALIHEMAFYDNYGRY